MAAPLLAESGTLSPMSLMAIHVGSKEQRSLGFVGPVLLSTLQPVLRELGFVSLGSLASSVPFLVGFLA